MNASPTFRTLAQVQTWLGELTTGDAVELGPANFVPPVAKQVFTVLNGTQPLALAVTAVAATGVVGTLSGTGIVLGEAGSSVKLTFAASAEDPLLVLIEAILPANYRWKPVAEFQFALDSLVATVSPEPSIGTANFGLAGRLVVDGQPPLAARLTLPAVPDSDWTLAATGPVTASKALLGALGGGTDPLSVIGHEFELQNFTVTDYAMAFGVDGSAGLFELGLDYAGSWLPLGSTVFDVSDFSFDYIGYAPFRSPVPMAAADGPPPVPEVTDWEMLNGGDLQALARATMLLGDVAIDVSVKFPDAVVFASLDKGAYLSVKTVFSGFHIRLPAGFPNVLATTVSFGIHARYQVVDLMVCIDEPVPITDTIYFDNFHFDLGIDCRNGVFAGQGDLFARFSFGAGARQTAIAMQGAYDEDGSFALNGEATGLSITEVIQSISAQFDVEPTGVPDALYGRERVAWAVSFERSDHARFEFLCLGDAKSSGRGKYAPDFAVDYDAATEKWQFQYQLIPPQGRQGG